MWCLIRGQRTEVKELIDAKHIEKNTWIVYLKKLYKEEQLIQRNHNRQRIDNNSGNMKTADADFLPSTTTDTDLTTTTAPLDDNIMSTSEHPQTPERDANQRENSLQDILENISDVDKNSPVILENITERLQGITKINRNAQNMNQVLVVLG
ncbi:hypothetical protein FQA39_LY08509 [Lamprigera yunnana]|nr:hypothetical protein FQA39_LY08509 [Lamprigera yunnana]